MRIHFLPVAALALCSCFRNPATGKMQLDLLSESQEVERGKQAKQEAEQAYGIYKAKPELNQYIADIGKRLSAESGRASLPCSYEIVDDASVNAFALPGGPVFITRGILGHLNTEAELAAVLGHETGHVAARHSANQMSKQQVAQIGLGIGSILSPAVASAAGAASAGLQLLFLKYSRDDETQADELGFRYMTKVGYDPRQMVPLFEMLDGVLQLSPAGKMSPDEAAQKLFSQQGFKAGQPVNVKGAKLARAFQAQTQQGAIEGVLAFFSWQGNTYLMAGYTPQGGLSNYANTFTDSMGSFSELTDSSALSVKPGKLKLVKIDRPMSVTEFQSSHPSTAKLEEVALINGVQQGGQIPAGYAKQIVGGTQ